MLINLSVFVVAVILISVVNSDFEDYGQTTAPDIEGELHMDNVPTGYLPDSVYRELAWYGILQIQPLYHSTKHKVAARWIWQNTLGRPHVVLENSPQATESEGKGGQNLMEESAKWVRDQRSAADVLMENIRAGGNGLTVRTVISSIKKSAYIIQNGKTYECGVGSEPDIDAFRAQSNMHERRCTEDKEPKLVSLDICMDAEFTPVEYSYVNGWNFCMGDGDRESSYTEDGDLDCGKKKKVSFDRFLEECSIDGNVVITFDYFGDEPRKDLIRNTTLCTSWDPCRFSYLYRIEVSDNDKPDIPTTTPDPCDTTFCPECLENYTEEPFIADITDNKVGLSDHKDGLQWVQTTFDEFPKYKDNALKVGSMYFMRALYNDRIIPGKLDAQTQKAYIRYEGEVINVTGPFEIAIPEAGSKLIWVTGNKAFDNAVKGGIGAYGKVLYLCRTVVNKILEPGHYYQPDHKCLYTLDKPEESTNYEVLINAAKPNLSRN